MWPQSIEACSGNAHPEQPSTSCQSITTKPGWRSGSTNEQALDGIRGRAVENETHHAGVDELKEIAKLVSRAGYDETRIRVDPSVVRGLEYYTGAVFEVELTFSTDGKDGSARFGSVGGGGRYDGLVSRFRGEPVPATGFSIGVSRLAAALEYLGKLDTTLAPGPEIGRAHV